MTTTTVTRRPQGRRLTRAQLWVLVAVWAVAIAVHIWYGNRHNFYDLQIYAKAMRWWDSGHDLYGFVIPDKIQGQLGYTYPPFAALLMRPLAWLPYGAAQAVYLALTVPAFVVTTWWMVAPLARRHGWSLWFVLPLALALVSWLEPIRETVSFGQINLLLVVLILADLLYGVPRKARWAGVGIGLAAAIKLTPAIFILYLLLTRRWRAALTATATALAATLLAFAVVPHESWRFWTGAIWDTGHIGHLDRTANQSIMGLLARLGFPNRALWAVLVLALAGYGLWRARRAALAGDEVTGLTLTGFVGILASPVSWTHHIYWFVPALVVLVDEAARTRRRRPAVAAAVIYATVAFSVVSWFEWGLSQPLFAHGVSGFLITNWYVLLMLVLLVALPIRPAEPAARRPPVQPPPPVRPSDPAPPRRASPAETVRSPGSADRSAT
jgi:alpha-1,2-mannosyltransferase